MPRPSTASGPSFDEPLDFPPPIVEVETDLAAFVGYTEMAADPEGGDLLLQPTLVRSWTEFGRCFGMPAAEPIGVQVQTTGLPPTVAVEPPARFYLLAWSVRAFFENGGRQCLVVSVGGYRLPAEVCCGDLLRGLEVVGEAAEPSLIVIPELVLLTAEEHARLAAGVLAQCADRGDRFAIFDVRDGAAPLDADRLASSRELFSSSGLENAAAYYPFVRSSHVHVVSPGEDNVVVTLDDHETVTLAELAARDPEVAGAVRAELAKLFAVLPPSGAVAGVHAATDAARGVWQAPQAVSLTGSIEPALELDDREIGELLSEPERGRSINVLRTLPGRGTVVWGARTLAGNDPDWRYLHLRRFYLMVRESLRRWATWVAFEANDEPTWRRLRASVEVYLVERWRAGALVGARPQDAFFVRCGLGSTMTEEDVTEGRLIVHVGMAMLRPSEFVELRFSHATRDP